MMEDTRESTGGWGGKRPGSGRPKGIRRPYKSVTLSLPVEYVEKLHRAAEKSGLSINGFIKRAIDEEIEKPVEDTV